MAKSWDQYLAEAQQRLEAQKNKDIADSNALYEAQKTQVNQNYNKSIDTTAISYDDQYRENAIQKLVNERKIAENMANLGLTDSGLNRTQQTAAQLSYGNNQSKINLARQQAIDSLTQSLANEISSIDINKLSAKSQIEKNYYDAAVSNAQTLRQQDVDAETARIKAYYSSLSAQNNGMSLKFTKVGEDKDGNILFRNSLTGKTEKFAYGVNPYTGGSPSASDVANYGVFDNGYQPKGMSHTGKLSAVKTKNSKSQEIYVMFDYYNTGVAQKLWKNDKGEYFYWNGAGGTYEKVGKDVAQQYIDAHKK